MKLKLFVQNVQVKVLVRISRQIVKVLLDGYGRYLVVIFRVKINVNINVLV